MVRIFVGALFALTLGGCEAHVAPPSDQQAPENGSLVSFTSARLEGDAGTDARLAHADGRSHLLAVMGEGLMFPGAHDADATRLGYLVIRGTGDALDSDEDRRFNAAAQRYAEDWNAEMLRLNPTS